MLAYVAAINDGADYIDCTVQITSDSVPICRESVDLLISTNIVSNPALYQSNIKTIPALQSTQGIFSFDLSWAEISTLKGKSYLDKFYNFLHGLVLYSVWFQVS